MLDMKKMCICAIVTMLLSLMIFTALLSGCGVTQYNENSNYENEYACGYFVEINCFGSKSGITYKIVYAKDTKVKYLIALNSSAYAITPLYNTDGTLQIYEE